MIKIFLNKGLGRIPYLFKLWRYSFRYFHPKFMKVHDFKLTTEVPILYLSTRIYYGVYCEKQFDMFSNSIKKGDIVVDLGAYIGYFSLEASKKAEKVYAFEPHLTSFNILKKNIQLNNLKNVVIENKAVYDKNSSVNFCETPELASNSYITPDGGKTIKTVTLDSYAKKNNIKSIDVLKIDIEGSEVEALKGARNIIKSSPRIKIFMEITLKDNKIPIEILDLINEENFSLNVIYHGYPRIDVLLKRKN